MLPLWIIDITDKSNRRDAFQRLVGEIDHVYIPKNESGSDVACDDNPESSGAATGDSSNESSVEKKRVNAYESQVPKSSTTEKSAIEVLDEAEKEEAARNAIIKGDYWYYNSYELDTFFEDYPDVFDDEVHNNTDQKRECAEKLYKFQEALVKDATIFIDKLRCSNARPYQPINIVVLGDASEKLTQLVFASIAIILQKEKGRFLQGHIHQGMSIFGMLYIPCDINTREVGEREKLLRILREIDVQHNLTAERGYDYMILYQNVQNRTECAYTKLNDEQVAQYMMQCIVHLFLACDINHPLIHGTGSDDTFYLSMGAASVYFDMSYEDERDACEVANNTIKSLKEEGDNLQVNFDLRLIDEDLYSSKDLISHFNVNAIDLDNENTKQRPHPIWDYFHRNLKAFYYDYRLRFYPAEMLRDMLCKMEEATSYQLDEVSSYCANAFIASEVAILPGITRVLSKVNEHLGGLVFIEKSLKDLQKVLSKEKDDIHKTMDESYWFKMLEEDNVIIPEDMLGQFTEYHATYNDDIQAKNSGAGCNSMKKDALDKFKALLSQEKTFLGTIARTFLMSLVCVLGILPILDFISPAFIDFGDVREHAFAWGAAVFMIPFFCQLISYYLYLRKRNRLVTKLKSYYMHDAHARVANRIEFEATEYYNKMIALLEEYLKRCEAIRKDKDIAFDLPSESKMLFPKSMFNQPLNGGKFGDIGLIPDKDIERSMIRVNYEPRYVNELTPALYFMLINFLNDEIAILFRDVKLIDSHSRRFNEEIGDYEFVSIDEQKKQLEQKWEENKKNFKEKFLHEILDQMVEREYSTVGEKVIQYKKKIDKTNILDPLSSYAATNGEVISQSDTEFADVKVNSNIEDLLKNLPLYTTRHQVSRYDEIYKKYIFVTRWRCFDHLSFNRLLPKEDFDDEIRAKRNFEEEMKKKKKEEENRRRQRGEILPDEKEEEEVIPYKVSPSSLILWSICPDDNSSEWLKLFYAEHFSIAYEDRKSFREVLNQND